MIVSGATHRVDVAIVGSGFAGSILARVLRGEGLTVALVERGRHPRFALGESSTPLAGFALERLAARYDLPDLRALSTWGRWRRGLPGLRNGLKRGFTFYAHRPGQPFANGPANEARLLVAASPDDDIADTHWLRADVDAHLFARAAAEGAVVLDETGIEEVARRDGGFRLRAVRHGQRLVVDAARLVDGSGGAGFLARAFDVPDLPPPRPTGLLYAHLAGTRPLAAVAPEAAFPAGPYPDERAAVHHLLEEGWVYVLPFDHGVASVGIVLPADHEALAPGSPPAAAARRVLDRYPSLAAALGGAPAVEPWARLPRMPYRRSAAVGEGWALLPHAFAFTDPMFSTGTAWSLLGVERLADVLTGRATPHAYGELLAREADQIAALIDAAWLAMPRFASFVAVTGLYFAAVSFAETEQRLGLGDGPPAWRGFLGVDDPALAGLPAEAAARLRTGGPEPAGFGSWLRERLAPRDLVGLDRPHGNLVPVDFELLVARSGRVGLTPEAMRGMLPRLRGDGPAETGAAESA